MSAEAARAVREAIELLGRASADWRNGKDAVPGPLHWPVAIHHARKRLQDALEAFDDNGLDLEDALRGSIWFNGLNRTERALWLGAAGTAVPAEAWSYYKSGGAL